MTRLIRSWEKNQCELQMNENPFEFFFQPENAEYCQGTNDACTRLRTYAEKKTIKTSRHLNFDFILIICWNTKKSRNSKWQWATFFDSFQPKMGTKSNPYHVQSVNRLLPKIEFIHLKKCLYYGFSNVVVAVDRFPFKNAHTHTISNLHSTHIQISKQ